LTVFSRHQSNFLDLLYSFLFSGELAVSELLSVYTLNEQIIIYVGYGITVFTAGLGFLKFTRNKKSRSSVFMAIITFFLPIIILGVIFRFSGGRSSKLISHRVFEFGYIIIGALSALIFTNIIPRAKARKKLIISVILICSMILIMLVGPMAGAMHPAINIRLGRVISNNGLSLNSWINNFVNIEEQIVSDRSIQIILSGYGNVRASKNLDLFSSENLTIPQDGSYIVVHKYMTDFYGTDLQKFDSSPQLCNIYTNGVLKTYKINNP
jgi:hypothetical protein